MQNKAAQVLDVFSTADIDSIIKILSKLKNTPNSGNTFRAYTNGFTENDVIYKLIDKIIGNKLENIISQKIHIACGMHLKELVPWEIHTDFHHPFDGDRIPDIAILVPLRVASRTGEQTHTVVFNEDCCTNFIDFKSINDKLDINANSIYNEYCSHIDSEDLEYVTLNGAYPWIPGSIIYWDRKLLHCSDNFLKNEITEKQALVLFTTAIL